eukprot:1153642-Prymnesium_polylepis.2
MHCRYRDSTNESVRGSSDADTATARWQVSLQPASPIGTPAAAYLHRCTTRSTRRSTTATPQPTAHSYGDRVAPAADLRLYAERAIV